MRGSRSVEWVRYGVLQSNWCTCAILMNMFTERTACCWRPTVGSCRKNGILPHHACIKIILASVSKA